MAYIKEPPKDLWIDRIFLCGIYLILGLGSLFLWIMTPTTPGNIISVVLLDVAGAVAVLGNTAAILGVLRFSMLIEMTAIWFGATGVAAYAFVNVFLALETPTRLAFLMFLLSNIAFINWRSWRLRRQAHRERVGANE